MSGRRERGMAVRREVLGRAHVERAEAAGTAFDAPFRELIAEGAWGTVWASDAIPRRERSMLTLALLAATGNFEEIPMHVRATARTGASREDVMQAFLHVAIYAGVPRANHAIRLARETFAEMDATDATDGADGAVGASAGSGADAGEEDGAAGPVGARTEGAAGGVTAVGVGPSAQGATGRAAAGGPEAATAAPGGARAGSAEASGEETP